MMNSRIAPEYDRISCGIGAAMIGCSMLYYVTPKEHIGLLNLADHAAVHYRDNAICKAHVEPTDERQPGTLPLNHYRQFRWDDQFNLDPVTARSYHDETLPQDGAKTAHFCSLCGPHFCSIKITEDVRKYAAEQAIPKEEAIQRRMEEKSKQFTEEGRNWGGLREVVSLSA